MESTVRHRILEFILLKFCFGEKEEGFLPGEDFPGEVASQTLAFPQQRKHVEGQNLAKPAR